jgi:hypothetical protein
VKVPEGDVTVAGPIKVDKGVASPPRVLLISARSRVVLPLLSVACVETQSIGPRAAKSVSIVRL